MALDKVLTRVAMLDCLKSLEKGRYPRTGQRGVVAVGSTSYPQPAASAATQESLRWETEVDSTMYHSLDSEFFQDLVQWCSTAATEELAPTIDSTTSKDGAHNIDTPQRLHTPHQWDVSAYPDTSQTDYKTDYTPLQSFNLHKHTPDNNFYTNQFQEQFLDINSLPVVMDDVPSTDPAGEYWQPANQTFSYTNTDHTKTPHTHNTMPFIDQEDSLDMKLMTPVSPQEVEGSDIHYAKVWGRGKFSEDNNRVDYDQNFLESAPELSWPEDIIGTPQILNCVEELEFEKCPQSYSTTNVSPTHGNYLSLDSPAPTIRLSSSSNECVSPKCENVDSDESESRRKKLRRTHSDSEDSDYSPYAELPTRKYKRKKPNLPIKDMIIALEEARSVNKARRGRPPKRRESVVSSTCSVDNASASSQSGKYRELRDKNNEASKRSRMNRKLKELQTEQMAIDLEERNKKLRVRADILEDMKKRLKDALMTAMLQK